MTGVVRQIAVRQSNQYSESLDDIVTPPPSALNELAPPEFPTVVQVIISLEAGQLLTNIENFYNLSHNGDINTRRRRVKRMYGLPLKLNIS
mmetsp:Transcript_1689/g.1507  ORF Transcript_1689/g.1507 Transcript_1689/m.1507 type:complete len:91 (-) Transcript_1689:32-304(-)